MYFKFWFGITIAIMIGVLICVILGWMTYRKDRGSGVGVLLGLFIGFGVFLAVLLIPRRAYVVTGEEEYTHLMIWGEPEYEMPNGEMVPLASDYDQCFVINETDEAVIIEEAVYGGYGFSGATEWVDEQSYEILNSHRIDYFYDDEPPNEISVKDDSEEVVRLWLRKRRK